jgi:trk system potassium uptake protein TrkA
MEGNKFVVIGVGRYGRQIALKLAKKGAEVYCFDFSEDKIESLKDDVAMAVTMDCTKKKNLMSQSIEDVDAAVIAIGENFEATILTCVHLIDIGIKRIIARASGEQQRTILEKVGVTEILTPEDAVAEDVVETLMNPSIISFLQLPDNYEIAEIKTPIGIANRTVEDIGLRDKYRLTLVTLKREFEEEINGEVVKEHHTIGVPGSDTKVYETDTLVVFGTIKDIDRLLEINS